MFVSIARTLSTRAAASLTSFARLAVTRLVAEDLLGVLD